MRTCIIRHGYHDDCFGRISHDDEAVTYERMEELTGAKLDRRRSYCLINSGNRFVLCAGVNWSDTCSGCSDCSTPIRGVGCKECGYTGRSVRKSWAPIQYINKEQT